MNKKFYICLFVISNLIFPISVFPQLTETEIEQIYESSEDFEYSEEQIDYIELTKLNKINLLYASIDDLTKFPFFDLNTSFRIIEFVRKNPKSSIEQLSKELSLIGEQIVILENCTYIEELPIIEKFSFLFRSRYKTTDNPIYGFEKSKFIGDKTDLSTRMKLNINNFGANLVIDKDAGERSLLEYYSGNIGYNDKKNFNVILGDFEYQLGMGNVLWQSFGDRKGINNIAPAVKFKQLSKPYLFTLDYLRFRGISVDYLLDFSDFSVKVGGFYSSIKKPATYDSTKNIITSIYTSGLYRTQTEINKIDRIKEVSFSGNFSLSLRNFSIGSGFFQLNYDRHIQTSSSKFPNSNNNLYKTFFAIYTQEQFSVSSELSLDEFNYHGFSLGSIYNLNQSKIAVHFRSFDKYFRSPYGTMFGEFSYPANEYGLYIGFYSLLLKHFKITSFIDLFKSYGPTNTIDKQINGFTIFNQFDYRIKDKLKGSTRFLAENKTNSKKISGKDNIFQEFDFLIRQEVIYSIKKSLNIRIRSEISLIDNSGVVPNEFGYATFVDISYDYDNFKFGSRLSLFTTDSYNSAIWQYEYFMQGYMYSFPAYLDGSRYVIYSKISLFNNFTLNLVYNYTHKNNIKSMGSGNDEILRNYSNNLFLQLNVNY